MKVTADKNIVEYIKRAQALRSVINLYVKDNYKKQNEVTIQDMYLTIILNNKKCHHTILYFYLNWFSNDSYNNDKKLKIQEDVKKVWNIHSENNSMNYEEIKKRVLNVEKDEETKENERCLFICLMTTIFAQYLLDKNDVTDNDLLNVYKLFNIIAGKDFNIKSGINKVYQLSNLAIALLVMGPYEIVKYLSNQNYSSQTSIEDKFNITKDIIAMSSFLASKYCIFLFKNENYNSETDILKLEIMVHALNIVSDLYEEEEYYDILKNIKAREKQCLSILEKKMVSDDDKDFRDVMIAMHFKYGDKNENAIKKEQKDFREYLRHASFITNMFDTINEPDKVILGRDDEVKNTLISLSKKTKSNIILIGQPGTGKTAIVEELARQIKYNEIPKFKGFTVMEINITSLVAGTKYRGELEQKLNDFIDFMMSRKNLKVILFIDEIHKIIGAGSSEESPLDVSNMLKPLLARDNIKLIGATTLDEYEKYICKDKALMRRFDTLIIKEPTIDKVYDMISAKIDLLTKYHDVDISREDIDFVINAANEGMKGRYFPDKALDVIDYCMARSSFENSTDFNKEFVNSYIENIKNDNGNTLVGFKN